VAVVEEGLSTRRVRRRSSPSLLVAFGGGGGGGGFIDEKYREEEKIYWQDFLDYGQALLGIRAAEQDESAVQQLLLGLRSFDWTLSFSSVSGEEEEEEEEEDEEEGVQ